MSKDNRPIDAAELRQHAEGARRVGQDEFWCIFERSHLGMSITQPSGEVQVNPAFCALLGYSPDEARQRKWQSFTHPDDVGLTQRLVDSLLAGEQVSGRLTKRFIHKNGSVVWADVNTTLHRDESGEPLHFVTIMIDITEHKRSVAALMESEELHRSILHTAMDGFWRLDAQGCLLAVNDAYCRMSGYSEAELLAICIPDLEAAESAGDTASHIQKVVAQGQDRFESRHRRKDGTPFDVGVSVQYRPREGGQMVAFLRDITERKQAEQALRLSGERYRTIVDHISDALFIHDLDGTILDVNENACRFYGYTRAELIGTNLRRLSLPGPAEHVAERLARLRAEGCVRFENVSARKDGVHVVNEVVARLVSREGKGIVHGFVRDITERKQAEEALRQSELKYRRLHETMTDAFVLVDMTGHILECNQSYRDMLGRTDAELRQLTYPDLTPERWHAFEARIVQEQILPHGFSGVYEKEYRRKDGVVFPVELRTSLIRDAAGQPAGMWAIIRDITARKRAEEALRESEKHLRQSEKMEAIGQLAGGVAHDFNNQLGGIMSCAELLLAKAHDEEARSCIEGIIRLCGRSADLTSKLLAFSRQGKHRTAPVNMHTIVAEVVSLLGRSIDKRICIRQRLDAMPPTTTGDPTQLQNVLINLGLNARDAMPAGGELLFATDAVTLDDEFCGKSGFDIEPGDFLRITVTDSGVGMDENTRAHLFEPFFTTKEPGKGTGLGLASVHGTVVNHRGAIEVDSEVGKGTTVTIHLPLLRQEVQEATGRGGSLTKATASAMILLVDDEEDVREFTARLLRRKGYNVVTASDGAEAVEYYGRSWQHIDLVILDLNMPKMSGRDAFIAMQKVNPHIRAILATGYGLDSNVQGMLDGGVVSCIHKPFLNEDLVQQVGQALGG